jgi:hypothetical protein
MLKKKNQNILALIWGPLVENLEKFLNLLSSDQSLLINRFSLQKCNDWNSDESYSTVHCKNSKARFPSIDGGGPVRFLDTG